MTKINTISDLEALRKRLLNDRKKFRATLTLCGGTGCQASRSRAVIDAIKDEIVKQGLEKRPLGCHRAEQLILLPHLTR
jgi:NADH-quinone oxidoreductase subunit F